MHIVVRSSYRPYLFAQRNSRFTTVINMNEVSFIIIHYDITFRHEKCKVWGGGGGGGGGGVDYIHDSYQYGIVEYIYHRVESF